MLKHTEDANKEATAETFTQVTLTSTVSIVKGHESFF